MIDLYYWTTPNGFKIAIFLEETGVPYKIHPVNLQKNEQFDPEFLKVSPNNKIPGIRDGEITLFESGAILMYLGRKFKKFYSPDPVQEMKNLEWLFWQVGGVGPMSGQAMHFAVMAKEKIPYAIDRFKDEVQRLYKVANTELGKHKFLGGDEYSIADMATYPWIVPHDKLGISLDAYPDLKRWKEVIAERPAVKRVYEKAKEINPQS
jgi:GST-like protein